MTTGGDRSGGPAPAGSASSGGIVYPRLQELAAEYEITRELGRGGTAIVYHARERELGRDVAIKVVHQIHLDDAEAVARLAREARLIARLRHPNIVTLFGRRHLGDGSLALIMQYVPGRTLKQAVREDGPLPIVVVDTVLREIGRALHYAHQRHGIVHRDIKPENIYLDTEGGRTLLSDFGIARTTEAEASLTIAGTALGTPAYMSPEQIDGLPLDGRSDLYSLGLVAYEMLTGQQPWAGHNLYTIIYKQKHEELPPLTEFRRDVPSYMQRAIGGLLRKDREERWRDAGRFVSELHRAAAFRSVAPPVITQRPSEPAASAPAPEDSPTIVFRPQADPAATAAIPAASAAIPAAGAAPPTGEPSPSAPPEPVTPVVRFFFDGDADDHAAAGPIAAAADDNAAAAPIATARRARRMPRLIGLGVFVALAGAMAPLIGANDDGTTELTESASPAAAPVSSDSTAPATAQGAAARLTVLTDDQTGVVGEPLTVPIGILVEDADGRPVAGAALELAVTGGGGQVTPALAISDAYGLAMARWTLGAAPGPNELSARIQGTKDVVAVVHATGIAEPAARLVAVGGTDQSAPRGSVLPDEIVLRVEDAGGGPVAGARIDFSVRAGGGTVQPASAETDASGVVRASWTIGDQETNTLRATLAQSGVHVDFAARARSRLSPQPLLAAGGTHTCMSPGTGMVSCWGANDGGQLGTGSAEPAAAATFLRSASSWTRLATGVAHTCALDDDGAAHCWGVNDAGQLGTGDRDDRALPAPVRTAVPFVDITAGLAHTCALAADGRAFCWGNGAQPAFAGGPAFRSITAGWRHTCGLTADRIAYCWGANGNGQLGDGTTSGRTAPTQVAGGILFVHISAGAAHTCGVSPDGIAYCWGQNGGGQLGSGSGADSPDPVRVQADVAFTSTAAGAVHTCGLTRSGEAYCWGRNNFGQLGNGSTVDSPVPVAVTGSARFTFLAALGSHTCGRGVSGEHFCWGYNVDGQLGDGTRTDRSRPVRVRAPAR
ncbi:MAG TPA: protein kinase [Longimicrobiales bacterium]